LHRGEYGLKAVAVCIKNSLDVDKYIVFDTMAI
jgi:hypothetical protein